MKKIFMINSKAIKSVALLFVFVFTAFSCDNLLDAANPNSLVEDDLSNPAAAGPMVNGAQASVTRALANILLPAAIASDEVVWSGSRDAWQQLNLGQLSDYENEFTDAAFAYVSEARWWADEVISRLEGFETDGFAISDALQTRAYIYGAIIYITIGDLYDDFAFSDKAVEGAPKGPANMVQVYDTAIGYLTKAIALGDSQQLQALLARAHWGKAAWTKARARTGGTAALIDVAAANTAAAAALGGADFILVVDSTTPDVVGDGSLAFGSEVNARKEQRLSDAYIVVDPATGNSVNGITTGGVTSTDPAESISLMDPIDGIPDPVLYDAVVDFVTSNLHPDFTITSEREMRLILAEAALSQSNLTDFATHINAVRALNSADGLTPWVDAVTSGISAQDLLIHERRVNLYLQGRRLVDHYRFNQPSVYWLPSSDAMNAVTFFPIGITEARANTLVPLK
ncbi:MAG: RagB/SusD family nutrient uptake outer membrane protein [Cyclobacteriaceae bacterium]